MVSGVKVSKRQTGAPQADRNSKANSETDKFESRQNLNRSKVANSEEMCNSIEYDDYSVVW